MSGEISTLFGFPATFTLATIFLVYRYW
jgi:hypothetical protein